MEENRLVDLELVFNQILKDIEESWKWILNLIKKGVERFDIEESRKWSCEGFPVDGCSSGTSGRHWDRNQM